MAKVTVTAAAATIVWADQVSDTTDAIFVEANGMIVLTARPKINNNNSNGSLSSSRPQKAKAEVVAAVTMQTLLVSLPRMRQRLRYQQDRARRLHR